MVDANFPGQHTTTTTVTTSTSVQTNIRFDAQYIKRKRVILKIVQVLCSLLGFICIQCSYLRNSSYGSFYSWISMIAFWFTGILLLFYLFHIIEKYYKIPWLKMELVFCVLWSLFYLIASSLVVSVYDNPFQAAAFFGYVAMIAYLLDAYLKYRAVRSGGLAQGSRVVSKQTTSSVESPPPREGY